MIDYLKTIIYKIQHKNDKNLFYIGHTTNLKGRFGTHHYQWKRKDNELYEMIRENGGISCFDMSMVKAYPCKDVLEVILEKENIRHKVEMDAFTSQVLQKSV
jgi:hypothetical protein